MEISMHNQNPQHTRTGFTSAVVVTASESNRQRDKRFLRQCGVNTISGTDTPAGALSLIEKTHADLVICDEQLHGARGLDFLHMLRDAPQVRSIPVILASTDTSEGALLDAVAAGCAGYLLRPYSQDNFQRQLSLAAQGDLAGAAQRAALERAARQAEEGQVHKAMRKWEHVVAAPENARDYYKTGCARLGKRDWNGAIVNFRKATVLDRLYAEAYEGLGKAWQGKGNEQQARKYMRLAAAAYSRIGRYEEARTIFVRVLKHCPETDNPFIDLGAAMVKRGDWTGAGRAYAQAMEHNGDESAVYTAISRACHFTDHPEATARRVAAALAEESGTGDASRRMKRILGGAPRSPRRAPQADPELSAPAFLPAPLADAWLVVKYTCMTYKKGRPVPAAPARLDLFTA